MLTMKYGLNINSDCQALARVSTRLLLTYITTEQNLIPRLYRLAKELGVDPEVILASSHGRRSIDTLALYDKSKANVECTFY
jgi:hypothetical protein